MIRSGHWMCDYKREPKQGEAKGNAREMLLARCPLPFSHLLVINELCLVFGLRMRDTSEESTTTSLDLLYCAKWSRNCNTNLTLEQISSHSPPFITETQSQKLKVYILKRVPKRVGLRIKRKPIRYLSHHD